MRRLVIGLAVGMGAWLLFQAAWDGGGNGRRSAPNPAPLNPFGIAERQAVSVLRGPTRPVPRALRTKLRSARNANVRSLRLNAARYVPGKVAFWAASSDRGQTCIIQARGGAVSCVPTPNLRRNGISLGVVSLDPSERRPKQFTVLGLVPDEVTAVHIQLGKKRRVVGVRRNSYSMQAPVPILVSGFER